MWRAWTLLHCIPERVLRMEVLGRREDGRAATHLIEVRLSPACETKEESFRNTSEEGEGCCRAQLEREEVWLQTSKTRVTNLQKKQVSVAMHWSLMRRFNLAQTRN